jgi:hypothetical protein
MIRDPEAHPFGPYRTVFRTWRHREKPHLLKLSLQGMWKCSALVGAVPYDCIGLTALDACTAVLAKQQEWWDDITRGRDIP